MSKIEEGPTMAAPDGRQAPGYRRYVDPQSRTISPAIFSDPDVYAAEQEQVFGHSWLFIGHELQLPAVGNYITTYMGEDGVIAVRDRAGVVRVYLNSCPHRGMKLCGLDQGTAKSFKCPYHAWTFNLQGELIAVPGFEEGYHGELDTKDWGLIEVPRVESYHGLIFASFDENIESLPDYLGEAKWYLDLLLDRTERGIMPFQGKNQWTYNGNWKLLAENFAGDNAHVHWTHQSIVAITGGHFDFKSDGQWTRSFLTGTSKGHAFITNSIEDGALTSPGLKAHRDSVQAEAATRLSPVQADLSNSIRLGTIFPNFGFVESFGWCALRLYLPKGPSKTEVWTWLFTEKDMPEALLAETRGSFIQTTSNSGIVEVDDAEMWSKCQEAHSKPYRRKFPLNYQMGAGHSRRDPDRPGEIHSLPSEHGVFSLYERWVEMMDKEEGKA